MDNKGVSTHLKDCQYTPRQLEKSPPPTPKVPVRKGQEEMAHFCLGLGVRMLLGCKCVINGAPFQLLQVKQLNKYIIVVGEA